MVNAFNIEYLETIYLTNLYMNFTYIIAPLSNSLDQEFLQVEFTMHYFCYCFGFSFPDIAAARPIRSWSFMEKQERVAPIVSMVVQLSSGRSSRIINTWTSNRCLLM